MIKRHAEDAGFYWMQRSGNAQSPILTFERLKHFDRLLNAHLDGLRVAGNEGWQIALNNLQRWRTNGEAFVAYLLAFEHDHERPQLLWNIVSKHPNTTHDGLVSALGWLAEDKALPWLEEWLQRDDIPLMQSIALRAYSIRRLTPAISLEQFFLSSSARVRASAYTLAGRMRLKEALPHLPAACKSEDLTEQASAIIAMQLLGQSEQILPDLWKTLNTHHKIAEENKGLTQLIARRRTETLARHLGHAIPSKHSQLQAALSKLPPRLALIVMAHHGDVALIPDIIKMMDDESLSRIAGWAFSFITGIDLDRNQLSKLAEPKEIEENELTTPIEDPDAGLPLPHKEAIQNWWQANEARFNKEIPLLLGNASNDRAHCLHLLRQGTQATRYAAALSLAKIDQGLPYVETRAEAGTQEKALSHIS